MEHLIIGMSLRSLCEHLAHGRERQAEVLGDWVGATPARRAARTALRCPSCSTGGVLLDLKGLACFAGLGTSRSRDNRACFTAASSSDPVPLLFSIRRRISSMSRLKCCANSASDQLASAGGLAGTARSDGGVGMVRVYSNRSRVRGEDPLRGMQFIWAFGRS